MNSPGGLLDYEVCACWSSANGFCEKSGQLCATSFSGANAEVTVVMNMDCGNPDVGYLDIQVKPVFGAFNYDCGDWSVSWSIIEGS